jgi:prepilin-type N-terminal cleavage/methylation domain-containing protein
MSYKHSRPTGFTIVELLIVVVVIAILAAISLVAYANIQGRAELARLQSDYRNISQGLELYRADNSELPQCPIAVPSNGCNFSLVAPMITTASLPTHNPQGTDIMYVGGIIGGVERWSVRFQKKDGSYCQMGKNYITSWWSSAPPCW